MSKNPPQDLKSHARFHPPFHFFLFPLITANFIVAIVHVVQHPSLGTVWYLVMSACAVLAVLTIRQYAVKVQDRVIRLEERLRLQSLAPAEWHTQIYRLNEDQLIGLRFAGDDEVVELAKQALEHNLTRKQIKERIKIWRPDYWRV
ncbi:MAG: DUF6526 family protein [Terracidiphilus sp.]|jgi:hypothetical protein